MLVPVRDKRRDGLKLIQKINFLLQNNSFKTIFVYSQSQDIIHVYSTSPQLKTTPNETDLLLFTCRWAVDYIKHYYESHYKHITQIK